METYIKAVLDELEYERESEEWELEVEKYPFISAEQSNIAMMFV